MYYSKSLEDGALKISSVQCKSKYRQADRLANKMCRLFHNIQQSHEVNATVQPLLEKVSVLASRAKCWLVQTAVCQKHANIYAPGSRSLVQFLGSVWTRRSPPSCVNRFSVTTCSIASTNTTAISCLCTIDHTITIHRIYNRHNRAVEPRDQKLPFIDLQVSFTQTRRPSGTVPLGHLLTHFPLALKFKQLRQSVDSAPLQPSESH